MPTRERLLWLVVTLLASMIVALVAGILSVASGGSIVAALISGGVAFAAAEATLLAIVGFAANRP